MLGRRRATAPTLRGMVGVMPTQPAGPALPAPTVSTGNRSFATATLPLSFPPAPPAVVQSSELVPSTILGQKLGAETLLAQLQPRIQLRARGTKSQIAASPSRPLASQAKKPDKRLACQTRLAVKPTPAKAHVPMRTGNQSGALGN